MVEMQRVLQSNLSDVLLRINAACGRVGRERSEVRLIAVTKYADWEWVRILAGLHPVFGENRPQQLAERCQQLPAVEWHLIGHLQRNKVPLALRHAALIHSVDSLRLLQSIAAGAVPGRRPAVLLQVNVSREDSKTGFGADELPRVWDSVLEYAEQVEIRGLMTMAAESSDPEEARPVFAELRHLRNLLSELPATRQRGIRLSELSMGMSGDFEQAVEEGATLLRIGSLLFHGLKADSG
ncbi:MAG: YggS family pyridoxal phosphate-dependent enzyme [Planctomycetaceae bacterium]|jgi:pyridoxal phosphate enzyme (YggS family)